MASILKPFEHAPMLVTEVKPFDFDMQDSKLPSTHSLGSSYVAKNPIESISKPVIDLANMGQKELDQLRVACEEWGFFQVLNHGVPNKVIEEFNAEVIGLFSRPMEDKLRALRGGSDAHGYGTFQISQASPVRMWNEAFSIQENRDGLYEHVAKIWHPNGNPKFCQVIEVYQTAMKNLIEKVLTHMLASLGLTPGDTSWSEPKTSKDPFGLHNSNFLLNSYPKCPDPSKAIAFVEHTDSSLVTVLHQVNNINSLQVLHNNKWFTVDPVPGAFLIIIGDLGHIMTNGQFLNPIHRVISLKDDHRYSAAYFYGPPREALVTPLPKLIGPDKPQVYRPFSWKDTRRMKSKYDTKMFEYMRIDRQGEQQEEY